MSEDKKKILVIEGVDYRSIERRLGGALDLGPAVVVATGREVGDFNNAPKRNDLYFDASTWHNEEPRKRSLPEKLAAFGLPGGMSTAKVPGLTLEPMEWNPTPAARLRETPPESRLRKARAALAIASVLTGSCASASAGVFVREDLRAGRCTHGFGLAGGFSSCAVCGVKTKKERKP